MQSKSTSRGLLSFMLLVGALTALMLGCGSPSEEDALEKVTREVSKDGLHVRISLSSDKISSSEMLRVELVVRCAESLSVALPEVGEKWGEFFIFDSRTRPAKLGDDGMVVTGRSYVLEPDLPGEFKLLGLRVKAVGPDAKTIEVQTESIPVQVTSVLASADIKLRDIAANERVEAETSRWPIALLISNVVVVMCLLILRRCWKKKQAKTDDHAARDFRNLKSASASEVMSRIERIVCQLFSDHYRLALNKVDFAGLQNGLDSKGVEVVDLTRTVVFYESLQFTAGHPDEADVRYLYGKFESVWKDVAS